MRHRVAHVDHPHQQTWCASTAACVSAMNICRSNLTRGCHLSPPFPPIAGRPCGGSGRRMLPRFRRCFAKSPDPFRAAVGFFTRAQKHGLLETNTIIEGCVKVFYGGIHLRCLTWQLCDRAGNTRVNPNLVPYEKCVRVAKFH